MCTDAALTLTDFLDITLYSNAEVTAASSEAEGYKYDLFVLRTGYLTFHKGQSSTLLISQILIHQKRHSLASCGPKTNMATWSRYRSLYLHYESRKGIFLPVANLGIAA